MGERSGVILTLLTCHAPVALMLSCRFPAICIVFLVAEQKRSEWGRSQV